jgi:hypothetical protein
MAIYLGERTIDGLSVTRDGVLLDPRFDVDVICREGFEWTYEGPAPQQLALALLADHLGDPAAARRHAPAFMREVVANFGNEWELTSEDIDAVLESLGLS